MACITHCGGAVTLSHFLHVTYRVAEVMDIPKLIGRMEELLMDHNGLSKRPMNLAIFL